MTWTIAFVAAGGFLFGCAVTYIFCAEHFLRMFR